MSAGKPAHAVVLSGQEPDHQRAVRCCSDSGGEREQRIPDHSRLCAGTGEDGFRHSGGCTDALSTGCHKLIYDGAGIAYTPEIILEELGISPKGDRKTPEKNNLGLASDLNMVYSCLDLRPKNPDHIVRKTGFSPARVSNCLVELMLRGLIRETGRHYYVRTDID